MDAYYVTVPAGWKTAGFVIFGACTPSPMPIVQSSSPDGLSGYFSLPRMDWVWGTYIRQSPAGCMPFQGKLSAQEFFERALLPSLEVSFVRELDSSQWRAQIEEQARKNEAMVEQWKAQSNPGSAPNGRQGGLSIHNSFDVGKFLVAYQIGDRPVEEVVAIRIDYTETAFSIGNTHSSNGRGSAWVQRLRAPAGRLNPEIRDTVLVAPNGEWLGAYFAAQNQARVDWIRARGAESTELLRRQHQIIMDNMNSRHEAHRAEFQDHIYNKQHAADNFVDYVSDCTRLSNNVSVATSNGFCRDRQTAPY